MWPFRIGRWIRAWTAVTITGWVAWFFGLLISSHIMAVTGALMMAPLLIWFVPLALFSVLFVPVDRIYARRTKRGA